MRKSQCAVWFFVLGVLMVWMIGPKCLALSCFVRSGEEPTRPPKPRESLKQFLQDYVRRERFDDDKMTRFAYAFVDLNGDGKKEAIVYLVGRWWCGTGGCPTLVLSRESESYRIVAKILITRPPIRVLNDTSNGWHSISVWVEGGGIQPGYEAKLLFDGRTYPISPANAPAQRLAGKAGGEVVISSSQKETHLYP